MHETIDIALRTLAVTAALLLGGLLLATVRQQRAALPGALFCFAVAAFFITSIPGGGAALGPLGIALTALCVTKAAWFWLFARALFRDASDIGGRHVAIVACTAIVGTWQQSLFIPAFREGSATVGETIAGVGLSLIHI